MFKAFVLLQAQTGKGASVGRAVAAIDQVVRADLVTGPFDVVALAEAPSIDEFAERVLAKIQAVDGVTRTMTCPVIHR